jgi:xanthosine utilization system XapX-like protein
MSFVKYLAVLPFLGILVGVPLLNQVQPLVMGMPLILAWIVLWVVLTAVIMAIVYRCDPANRDNGEPRA